MNKSVPTNQLTPRKKVYEKLTKLEKHQNSAGKINTICTGKNGQKKVSRASKASVLEH